MLSRLLPLKTWGLVRREQAEQFMVILLLSFAASVSLTRLFLSITGYPQVGGGELHIAHVLWGGLFLFLATLFILLLSNRRIYLFSAILAGIGMGLFIDEVGKFITSQNDYFYPAAAPIIYVFFMATVLAFLQLRRVPATDPLNELSKALEVIQEMLNQSLFLEERTALEDRLERVVKDSPSTLHVTLASSLLQFIRSDTRPPKEKRYNLLARILKRVSETITGWMTGHRLRIILEIGLICLGLLAWKNPASSLLSDRMPALVEALHLNAYIGHRVEALVAPELFQLRVKFELLVGFLLLGASLSLFIGRYQIGFTLGSLGLLLSLTSVDPLVFYFEQFSTIIMTIAQFVLLTLLLYYRSRYLNRISLTSPLLEVIGIEAGGVISEDKRASV